jgi:hypothetical protein
MKRSAKYPPWYDPAVDTSPFMAKLDEVRRMCTRAEVTLPNMTVPGSHAMIQGVMHAIDDFAELETGHRGYFWGRPPRAGG